MFEFDDMKVKYPLGEQSFRELRRRGCLYIDKTEYVARLITQGKFIFLSRPRRFGKSLLLSTIECYFQGEKELFEGTWIGAREKEWKKYPVLHFDMTVTSGESGEEMKAFLHERISKYEEKYQLSSNDKIADVGRRFNNLIWGIFKKMGSQVVILIDEYDKGILETLDEDKVSRESMSNVLRAFYSQPKEATEAVRFCMVTGVARFGSYTLFSGPNNYNDVSMVPHYAAACGITQQELIVNFQTGIQALSHDNGWDDEKTISVLRHKYDSYRFSKSATLVYNPFSLLSVFTNNELGNYWIKSGTSKVFVKYLNRSEFDIMELQKLWVTQSRMEAKYTNDDAIPLLFQTGYLTIKDIKKDEGGNNLYLLDIPNGEVRSALVEQLMPMYMGISESAFVQRYWELKKYLYSGEVCKWIELLKSMIAKIPYHLFNPGQHSGEQDQQASIERLEKTYHIIVQIIFQMLNIDSNSEISVSGGRIDMVAQTDRYVYVMEFKLNGTPEEALAQIDSKGYALSWSGDGRQVYKIGIVFSSTTRTISSYSVSS